jgi:CelD/BcsL family acetyltransferase involved in cellulose biosynthesis
MSVKYESIRGERLTPDLVQRWREIQAADTSFQSPFLTPDWTQLVASIRTDVEVAVLEEAGEVVGFFPFQRTPWNKGRPVGGHMCDVQAVIATSDAHWDAADLVRACRLRAWDFHHVPASQTQFAPHAAECAEAISIDLSDGFEGYEREKRGRGSQHLKKIGQTMRKAERAIGPMRVCVENENGNTLQQLMTWKSAQYRRSHAADVFAFPWIETLVRQTLTHTAPAFCGLLSALYYGETLAAAELGLRHGAVFHGWITAYNPDLRRYSPGSSLLMEIIRHLPTMGVTSSELGKNNLQYKALWGNATRPIITGCVAVAPCAKLLCLGRRGAVQLSRSPWMAAPTRLAKRVVGPLRGWLRFA